MKYFTIIICNLIGIYIFYVFTFGKNGIVHNIEQINYLYQLKQEKYLNEIELDNLKIRYEYLKSLNYPDNELLVYLGLKYKNSIIFKFIESDNKNYIKIDINKKNLVNRIYFIFILYIITLITGNIILITLLKSYRREKI